MDIEIVIPDKPNMVLEDRPKGWLRELRQTRQEILKENRAKPKRGKRKGKSKIDKLLGMMSKEQLKAAGF